MSEQTQGKLTLMVEDHKIGYVLPPNSRNEGRLVLPHGALIRGEYVGDLLCETGSIIVQGGRIRGRFEAEKIYIGGEVVSAPEDRTILLGHILIAAGNTATIDADLFSRLFALHKAKVNGTVRTLEEADEMRLLMSNQPRAETPPRRPRTTRSAPAPAPASSAR